MKKYYTKQIIVIWLDEAEPEYADCNFDIISTITQHNTLSYIREPFMTALQE